MRAIPVVRLIPTRSSGRLTVIADSRGKAGLADARRASPRRSPAPCSPRARASSASTRSSWASRSIPSNPVAHRPDTVHFETYNPSLAADQMQDLATVLAWARSQPDVREVSLVGQGLAGSQVLLARPLLEGLARTVVDLAGWQDTDGSGPLPPALDLPGLFQFGGFKAAAALSAPAPFWILRAGPGFRSAWPETAYELAGSPQALRFDPEGLDARGHRPLDRPGRVTTARRLVTLDSTQL